MMPSELTQKMIQTILQLPIQQREQLIQLLLESLNEGEAGQSSDLPTTFFDPETAETYGIETLRKKLAEAEEDRAAGRVRTVDLQQELRAALERKTAQQTVSE